MVDEILKKIQIEWDKDSVIKKDDPDALGIHQLHGKYWKYLIVAKQELIPLKEAYNILKEEKTDFLLHPMAKANMAIDRGWKYPCPGEKILKTNLKEWLAKDNDLISFQGKIDVIELRIEFLYDILKAVHNRSFLIGHHIEWEKFRNGIF